ncbi:hypothetical protein MMC28_004029 [Mycoblastus sanguinarius]|nr:hypothetical protein [Mycoblastus sanguinarius]
MDSHTPEEQSRNGTPHEILPSSDCGSERFSTPDLEPSSPSSLPRTPEEYVRDSPDPENDEIDDAIQEWIDSADGWCLEDTEATATDEYIGDSLYLENLDKYQQLQGWGDGADYGWSENAETAGSQCGNGKTDHEPSEPQAQDDVEWDSKYSDIEETPPRSEKQADETTKESEEITKVYFDIDPKTRHRFLNYLRVLEEASCWEFVNRHYPKREDGWGLDSHLFRSSMLPPGLENKQWEGWGDWRADPEFFELNHWGQLLKCLKPSASILSISSYREFENALEAMINIRHAAVKRHALKLEDLRLAMRVPAMLRDLRTAEKIEQAFDVVRQDTEHPVAEDIVQMVLRELDPETTPLSTQHQVLSKWERLSEELMYEWCKRDDPELLIRKHWTASEQVSIQMWSDEFWWYKVIPQDVYPDPDRKLFYNTLCGLRRIRNDTVHRQPLDENEFDLDFKLLRKMALIVDNQEKAIEFEITAEEWVTKSSRRDVLARLRNRERVFLDLDPVSANGLLERKRRGVIFKLLVAEGIDAHITRPAHIARLARNTRPVPRAPDALIIALPASVGSSNGSLRSSSRSSSSTASTSKTFDTAGTIITAPGLPFSMHDVFKRVNLW